MILPNANCTGIIMDYLFLTSPSSFIIWLWEARYSVYFIPLLLVVTIKFLWSKAFKQTTALSQTTQPFQDNRTSEYNKGDQGAAQEYEQRDADSRPSMISDHVPYRGLTIKLDETGETFYNLVNDRRSVRKFNENRTIDRAVIEKCILAAGTSPSGAHTEPWTFCLIENAEIKYRIREIIEREEYINYTQRMSRQWTADLRPLKTDHIKEYLTDAPYLILAFKQIYGFRSNGGKQQHYYNEISMSIAIGILLCALQSVGLNSLVTTPMNCGPAIRLLLDRPINEKLLVLMPVGYAAHDCLVPDLQRKAIQDILVTY